MAHEPIWARTAAPKAKASGASCVACMVFVAGMGAAFWIGNAVGLAIVHWTLLR